MKYAAFLLTLIAQLIKAVKLTNQWWTSKPSFDKILIIKIDQLNLGCDYFEMD